MEILIIHAAARRIHFEHVKPALLHGWRIHNVSEEVDYWLCKACHLDKAKPKRPKGHVLVCTKSTSSSISHLKNIHGIQIGEYEPIDLPQSQYQSPPQSQLQSQPQSQPQGPSQRRPQSPPLLAVPSLSTGHKRTADGFDSEEFLRLLVRCFVKTKWPFTMIESPEFRHLLIYSLPRCEEHLPSSAAELHELYALKEPHL